MKKRNMIATEAQEQRALIKWAQHHPICRNYLVHYPNGGFRNLIEAVNLKRAGAKAGVSDLLLAYPCHGYHGLWIELKRFRNPSRLTKDQQIWLTRMRNVGYVAVVAQGWEVAKSVIEIYLKGETVPKVEIEKFHA